MKVNIRSVKISSKGFTLPELLIGIAILGIIASVAIPTFSGWMPKYRLKSAVRDLYSNMQLAKMSAIKSNERYRVIFNDSGNGSYVIEGPGGAIIKKVDFLDYDMQGNIGFGIGDATKSATTSGSPIPSDFISYQYNRATFNSRGLGSSGYVYLANGKGAVYAVGTWSAGIIVMKKWNSLTSCWE